LFTKRAFLFVRERDEKANALQECIEVKRKRRQSRETAFSLIFEWGFREEERPEDIIAQAVDGRAAEVDEFARVLASRTIENCAALDNMIKQYSHKWKLGRIPRVTLALLRMSFCELSMFPEIPVGATINEAVELAKKYATEEDAAYLNGILGQYDRDRIAGEGEGAAAEEEDSEEQEGPGTDEEDGPASGVE